VALKLTVILAMLLGLVTYAYSTAIPQGLGPSRADFDVQLKREGYVKIGETPQSRGMIVETFEMRVPTRPHYHVTAWLELICRDGCVINFSHNVFNDEVPDEQSWSLAPTFIAPVR
jgi:hypothetical protein